MPTSPLLALRTSALAALAISVVLTGLPSAQAATPKHYASCAQLQKSYPHGLGKSGAKDKTSGKPVRNFKVDTALYTANDGPRNGSTGEYDLDRDNDGVAWERV